MKKALVVGIDHYAHDPLTGCVADATAIAALLKRNGDGSPGFGVETMTSDSSSVTRSNLRRMLTGLFETDCETALFYFSGHGMIDPTGGSVVTADAEEYDEGISMDQILSLTNQSKARNKVVILDCCHSGAFGTPATTGSDATEIANGVSILTASRDREVAIEIDGHGVFTSLLIDALSGGAADLRGTVTPGSLYAYVDEALGAWDQRPVFRTNVSTLAVLRTVVPRVSHVKLRRLTEFFSDPSAHFDLDPSYEFTEDQAIPEHVEQLKVLQEMAGVGLVVPVDDEHMYFAAMNSTGCRLTAIGAQYWRMVDEGKL